MAGDAGDDREPDVITVLLVDDQPELLRGLEMLLTLDGGVRVVGAAASAEEALALARRLRPDVVLMDVQLPGMDGITATRRLRAGSPASRVIVLTLYDDPETRRRALQAGAAAFVAKHDMEGALLVAIRSVSGAQPPAIADERPVPRPRDGGAKE